MLRPGKSSNGSPNSGGGYYNSGGYNNAGYSYNGYGNNQGYSQSYGGGYSSGYPPQQTQQYDVYAQPQQVQSPRRNRPESLLMKLFKNKLMLMLLVCFVLFLSTMHYRCQHKATLTQLKVSSVEEAVQRFQDTERERSKWRKDNHVNMHAQKEYQKKIDVLKQDKTRLEIEKDDMQQRLEDNKVSQKRQDAMEHQIELLQQATSRESKRAVLEKYGPGPHQVKMAIQIPNDKLQVILVEMAPLDLVPHAIHLFLEQVSHKLWDGTYIYLNGPHVMQSGPVDYQKNKGKKDSSKLQRFVDAGLDKLAFPEYSPDFPHLPFTLGYTGRPGGPDFYINKGNNTVPHGPGGQAQYGIQEQADSCFGIVVEGQSTIEKLQQIATHKKGHEFAYFFKEPVSIMWARIVEKNDGKKKQPNNDEQKKKQATENVQRNKAAQQVPASNPKAQAMKNEGNQAQAKTQPKAQNMAQAQPKTQNMAQPKAQNMAQTQPKAQNMAQAQPKAQNMAQAQVQPKAQNMAQTQPKAQNMAQAQAQQKAQNMAQAQAQPKAQKMAQAQAQPKAQNMAQAQPKAQNMAQARAQTMSS